MTTGSETTDESMYHDNIIQACTRDTMMEIVKMRNPGGYTLAQIAEASGFALSTVQRYLRVYDKYGIEAFAQPYTK